MLVPRPGFPAMESCGIPIPLSHTDSVQVGP